MIEYIAGTSHGAPKPIRPPCVFTGKSAGEYASLEVRLYLSSTHRPPSPRSASPHASTARRKQMGKQSYSPNQSMSDGRSWASEKAARVACSQLNIASSMTGGGYSGPLASPPPNTTTPPLAANGPSAAAATPDELLTLSWPNLESMKSLDATMIAAPPSALLAHSSSPVAGATEGAARI
eukprot:scaffold80304_cov71-Phaeocystis_antarctica.AAC.6